MNLFRFFIAFHVFVLITVVVYRFFPPEWKQRKWLKRALLAYHIIGIFSLELTFLVYREIPYRWLQKAGSAVSTFYYVPIMLMGILFVTGWVISRVYDRLSKNKSSDRNIRVPSRSTRAVLVITVSYLITIIGFLNFRKLHLKEYDMDLPSLNRNEPLDICLLADIHAGSGNRDALYDEIRETVMNAEPDLILIDGDIFDETTGEQDVKRVCEMLGRMEAPLGMYFTFGNHDDAGSKIMMEQLESTGAVSLQDEVIRIGDDLVLVGRKDDGEENRLPVSEILASEEIRKSDSVLVLQHRPTEFRKLAEAGADLVMAGHTHGFNIPMIAAVYWRADSVYGMKTYDDMKAVVTSGVSGWGFCYKFPAINEVVLLHIH